MIISVLVNIPPLIALLVTLLRIFGMTSRNNTHDTANIANIANKTLQTTQLRGGNLHFKWWRQNKMSKCCVFTSHCFRAAPRKKCRGTIQRTSVWQETITHFLLSIFIPSACAGWAGLGWAGLGWAGRGADITHCVLWRVDKLSAGQHLPRTLYLYSHYLHYLHYIYRVIIFTIYRVIVYIIYLQISTPSLSAAAQDKVVVATSQFCSLHKWNCNFPDHRPTEMQAPCPALQK